MGREHSLGPAGRARCEHHTRRGLRAPGRDRIGVRPPPDPLRLGVHPDKAHSRPGSLRGQCRVGDHHTGTGVLGDRKQPVDGEPGVQHRVCGAGLEHGQHRDHHLHATVQVDAHHLVRAHSVVDEVVCQTVGACVEFFVGGLNVLEDHGGGRGCTANPGLEQFVDALSRYLDRGAVPLDEGRVTFRVGQQVDSGDPGPWFGRHQLQDTRQMVPKGVRGGLVEDVGGVLDLTGEPRGRASGVEHLAETDHEVELRDLCADLFPGHGQIGGLRPGDRVGLQHQHHLEQWLPGRRPVRSQVLHQQVERDVLIAVRAEIRLTDPAQQLLEGGVSRQVGPQHQRVHEESDQVFQRLIGTPRHRGADHDVVPRAVALQPDRQRGLQHHEQAGALRLPQARQCPVQLGVESEMGQPAVMRRFSRVRPVDRQRQLRWRSRQRVAPVRQLFRPDLRHQLLVPRRVIAVLHRQRHPLRGGFPAPRLVRMAQVPRQRRKRPAITRDVMHDQHQYVHLGRQPEQPCPHRDVALQIEGTRRHLAHHPRQLIGGHIAQPQLDPRLIRPQHFLSRHPVPLRENAPQGLVPLHHIVQRRLQGRHVQAPDKAQPERHVVCRPRPFQLAEKPKPPLSE
ncbi:hypothetical protein SXANM310S_00051 [Streptomyces xanthochromogenes]